MSERRTMTCVEVRDRLPLVPGADLLPAEDHIVRAHLADCAKCRRELGAFVRVRGELRGLAAQEMLADHVEFFAELRDETLVAVQRDAARQRPSLFRPIKHLSLAGVMTAAALFLIGVYLVSHWLPESSGIRDLQPIYAPAESVVEDGRFRNVGYGLSGHRPRLAIQGVPWFDLPPERYPLDGPRPKHGDASGEAAGDKTKR